VKNHHRPHIKTNQGFSIGTNADLLNLYKNPETTNKNSPTQNQKLYFFLEIYLKHCKRHP